jgi:hypothetical protein
VRNNEGSALILARRSRKKSILATFWADIQTNLNAAHQTTNVTSAPVSNCIGTFDHSTPVVSFRKVTYATGAGGSNSVEL